MTGADPGDQGDTSDLDALGTEAFVAAVAPLFEGAPRFLARLAAARPFDTTANLFETARAIAHAMPETDQIELIDAHPRLGAAPGAVSAMSYREQGHAQGSPQDAAVAAELDRLNAAYEGRFGFRYCVFVAGRSRADLLPEMTAALGADRRSEIRRALDAVIDIAADRRAKMTR